MIEFFQSLYPWFKAFHIMSVIAWMAGLFYLPRLFVRHAENRGNPDNVALLTVMEEKLYRVIMNPAMMASWLFAILIIATGAVDVISAWFAIKFIAVLAMTGFHIWCKQRMLDLAAGIDTHSGRYYRFANEVPTVLMVIIVIMAVVKPF